jgi:L-alanine-DL-glutamate epimerase-like enolase superfamily enzyme
MATDEALAAEHPRVEDVAIARVSIALPERITSGIHQIDSVECVLVTLSSGGSAGCGYAFCFNGNEAASIEAMANDLVSSVRGSPVHLVRATWAELWRRTNFIGHAGPPLMALSAFDMALWDLLARTAGQPLYKMLGAQRDEVTVYAAGGWLSLDVDDLCQQAVEFKETGYSAYKMRVGNPDWRADVARVKAVREAIGHDMLLMVDVNQAWDVPTAVRAARAMQDYELSWVEEPVDVHDVEGCARVARAVEVPIAAGETTWGPYGLMTLLSKRAVDILQPDLMRCAGITGFLSVAHAADAVGIPVVSHLFTPISAHLMATLPRSDLVEYIPGWFDALFAEAPTIEQGKIRLDLAPGTGVKFAETEWQERS